MDTETPLLMGPMLSLPAQVGCSQLLKESEKPLQGGAPSGQGENLSSNSPGGNSASMGEFQHQNTQVVVLKISYNTSLFTLYSMDLSFFLPSC